MDKRYQIFVSSTYADLAEERSAVIQAVMKMGHIPAGMELFSAVDEEQFQFIKRIIDDSDYYVLIIGGRYGTVTAEGLSYTEKEYNYAVERGLRVIAFLHKRPEEIPLGKSEGDPKTRKLLDDFRGKVSTGRVIEYWTNAAELVQLITTSLVQTMNLHPAIGWVRADQLANSEALSDLNELRKANESLTRRNNELSTAINEMRPRISNLAGLDETITLSGTIQARNTYSNATVWSLKVTWGDLFAAIGPHILQQPNDSLMSTYFDLEVKELLKKEGRSSLPNWEMPDSYYQTVKVQLMALNLANVEMHGTINGGQSLFWSLTDKGKALLLQLRTVKTSTKQG